MLARPSLVRFVCIDSTASVRNAISELLRHLATVRLELPFTVEHRPGASRQLIGTQVHSLSGHPRKRGIVQLFVSYLLHRIHRPRPSSALQSGILIDPATLSIRRDKQYLACLPIESEYLMK